MTRKTLLVILLLSLTCLAACRRQTYDGGSLAVVTMVGAHIKARDIPIVTKYVNTILLSIKSVILILIKLYPTNVFILLNL